VKKFKAVPEERRADYYAKAKASLNVQLEKAKAKKNARLTKKIEETLEILEYILGGSDESEDEAIINGALPE
jgi:hypothetical protein